MKHSNDLEQYYKDACENHSSEKEGNAKVAAYTSCVLWCTLYVKERKLGVAFYTTLFQPEHLNIKLNTGELFSLLILSYCKMYTFC